MDIPEQKRGNLTTWIWIVIMSLIIVATGLFAFFVVSDKGQPDWDFRPARDLPSESPEAEYELLPNPQHIRGKEGD